jgi:hypothetical protein
MRIPGRPRPSWSPQSEENRVSDDYLEHQLAAPALSDFVPEAIAKCGNNAECLEYFYREPDALRRPRAERARPRRRVRAP